VYLYLFLLSCLSTANFSDNLALHEDGKRQ
jgi:hypothetical protein